MPMVTVNSMFFVRQATRNAGILASKYMLPAAR